MSMLQRVLSFYMPYAPQRFVYMLQRVEYRSGAFLSWIMRLPNLGNIQYRGSLKLTRKARALLLLAYVSYVVFSILSVVVAWYVHVLLALLAVTVPLVTVLILSAVTAVGAVSLRLIRKGSLERARVQFAEHPAVKIAVLGSYGKTTMKELLATVLSEGKRIAATPGNMNVPLSHARWAERRLDGSEEVIILEYGEGEPGDIAAFAKLSSPDYAILTGVAPNHLDRYADYQALQTDLASITEYVSPKRLYCNAQVSETMDVTGAIVYDQDNVGAIDIRDVRVSIDGVSFTIMLGTKRVSLHSPLLGVHQVGPLAAVAVIAHELGLSVQEIEAGIAKTQAFEHRMQPRLFHGAWIIDDTYNGNLEGFRAGLALLRALDARRKIYVTPGLVDQGVETQRVHQEIGMLIANAQPDKVVLMHNSVTSYIESGLQAVGYDGEVVIETRPKEFYENIEQHVASGELYMLQNDWPDEYR